MSTINHAITELQHSFDTIGPYFLSDFYKDGGKKRLYEWLTSIYQPEYQNNCRVLIVQDCNDVYDYQDLPGLAIRELHKFAKQIDISNFFFLVVTGNTEIKKELTQACALYSGDACLMQYCVINLPYSIKIHKSDTFCVLPWMHLYIGTDGNVLPCCVSDHQHPMGNINQQSITTIIQSPGFTRMRYNMLNGFQSKECSMCYQQEEVGIKSARQFHNKRWNKVIKDKLDPDGTVASFAPLYLDIRLNNICNLKCRMCSGYFSSAIAQEEVELWGSRDNVDSALRSTQRKMGMEEICSYLSGCEKIYFAGGEPMLSLEHYNILDQLIHKGNTDLEIIYNTNFTTLSYRGRNVLDLWKHFSNVRIGASLDAQGAVAEYVRYGTKWSDIENNLTLIKQECPHVKFTVTSTVGLLNIFSLIDLQKNWNDSGMLSIDNFSQSILLNPDHLTLTSLPFSHKKRLERKIQDHIAWCTINNATALAIQWNNVLTYMWFEDKSHYMSEFKRITTILDQYRNQSLADVLPEYKDLM